VRIATYNVEMTRAGPGLLLRDILGTKDPQIAAVVEVIQVLDADILLLTGIDYDLGQESLRALADRLSVAGIGYPHRMALRPNTGIASGFDLDGNGRWSEARDALAFGRFPGAAGMAVLSRYPIVADDIRTFTGMLWQDLPGALLPPDLTPQVRAVLPLSTSGHYEIPIEINGVTLRLLAWYATPPVFDGPEDRNGRRNHDEAAVWLRLLDATLPSPPPQTPFVILGQSNLDPVDGEGRRGAMLALLGHSALQDPAPRGSHGRTEPGGDPALDTALYDRIGGLRVEVILPSADLAIAGSGVIWPPDTDALAATLSAASRHRPVWVDIEP